MMKFFKIKTILFFLLSTCFVANLYAMTKNDILKVSQISETKLQCVYFASETKLAKTKANGSYSYLNITNKL